MFVLLSKCNARVAINRLWTPRGYATALSGNDVNSKKHSLGIIGVPFHYGQPRKGVELAPDLLRKNNLIKILESAAYGNLIINDYGNLKYKLQQEDDRNMNNIKNYSEFMSCNKALMLKVQEILENNDQFLTIGGDHSIGFGSVAGHLQHTPNLSLIWIDAHADINLHSTSETGNTHGMPVSFLIQELRKFWKNTQLDKITPNCLRTEDITFIGLRDIDPSEAYIINKLNIRSYPMDIIDKVGITKIIEMTLDSLKPSHKIHMSFDIDALDSIFAPSTGTIVHGGLTLREGISIVEAIRDTNQVQGIDLVEVNPKIGSEQDVQRTIESSLEILKTLCGYKRGGTFANVQKNLIDI